MPSNKSQILLSSLEQYHKSLKFDDTFEIDGLHQTSAAAFICDIFQSTGKPQLVVCPDDEDARQLTSDIRFLLGKSDDDPEALFERKVVTLIPDDLSPYEGKKFITGRSRQMELINVLYCLSQPFRPPITVTTALGLMRQYLPKSVLLKQTEYLLAGADIDRDSVLKKLVEGGYSTSPIVEDAGTFSSRGGIVDVFSPLYKWPLRLDFFGDTLESIRLFNPANQKSIKQLEEAYVIPVREITLNDDSKLYGGEQLQTMAMDLGQYDRKMQALITDLENGLYSPDLDPYMPLFYEELVPIFAYLSSDTRLFLHGFDTISSRIDDNWKRMLHQFNEREQDQDLTLLPEKYVIQPENCIDRINKTKRTITKNLSDSTGLEVPRFMWKDHEILQHELKGRRGSVSILEPLLNRLRGWISDGIHVFIVARNEKLLHRLEEMLKPYKIKVRIWTEGFPNVWDTALSMRDYRINLVLGNIKNGQIWENERVVFIAEEEIFGARKRRTTKQIGFNKEAFLSSLDELKEGDFLVHVEFGVGVYHGLKHLEAGGVGNDFLHIEYLGGDKLYLPATRLEKIQKYSGAESNIPQLDRLGGTRWLKTKERIKESLRAMAEELLKLYAEREVADGVSFSPPDAYYREFESTFPYEETHDQERAIKDVIKDMQKNKSMDRLVCGDVGFGKTEVAIRAAFKAVVDKFQVAILVPTTVLAFQHGETFKNRFKDYPINIESISRFKSAKEQKEILQKVKENKVDIVIGTHRLLSKDVEFANLGLLVVDEEQRFGVKHKERIKQLKASVDILTMTATPIPRTLNLAFTGVRDISVIQSPPIDRLSIRTFVSKFDEDLIGEAIASELGRGGQVYFVHNRISSIEAMASQIKILVPQARVTVAHGQMGETKLEEIMMGFMKRETNVLVTTAIIESGIDIPSVNTIIVNRADTFGLAQLYQLRGRVGRGKNRAYAYLLVPSPSTLTKIAQKRLAALMRFTELGSGFRIASHDLEIRGAGNLLGKQQSGHIAAIGIDLYLQLIEEAVQELKGQQVAKTVEPQINVSVPAYLPESFIEEPSQRLYMYKRLSSAQDLDRVDELVEEMEDRFGKLPTEAQSLIKTIELKVSLRDMNIAGMDLSPASMSLSLGDECSLDPQTPINLITKENSLFQLTPDMKLIRKILAHEREDIFITAKNILQKMQEYDIKSRQSN